MFVLLFFSCLIVLWLKILINVIEIVRLQRETLQRKHQKIKMALDIHKKKNDAKLFIITPALNEQKRIDSYISNLIQKLESHSELITQIIILCNEKEKVSNLVIYYRKLPTHGI